MYVKRNLVKNKNAYYFRKEDNQWYDVNEYGDVGVRVVANDNDIMDNLKEGYVSIVENPTFEKKVIWPRVFKFGNAIRVFDSESSGSYNIGTHLVLVGPNGNDSFIQRANWGDECHGDERSKILNVLEVLKCFRS